ncbi:MAG TPA: MG2 domain-containing protein [Tepidisphaeraceae bacterium]
MGLASAYQCNVPLGSELAATEASAYAGGSEDPLIRVRFNNAVDLNVLKPLISVEPAVRFTLQNDYQGVELHGPFEPATRYAIKIAAAPKGVPRQSRPRPATLSVFVPDRSPSVRFEHEEGYLGSAGNRTVLAHAVNVTGLRASVTRIYDNNLVAWRNLGASFGNVDRPIATRDIRIAPVKNKVQDVRLSLDDLLPAGAPRDGVYLLQLESKATTDSDDGERYGGRRQDSAMLTLSDIGLTAKQGRTAITVWATSLRTAEPLVGVRVRVYSNKNQFLGEAKTDANGLATIAPAPTAEGETPSLLLADRPDAPVEGTPQGLSPSPGSPGEGLGGGRQAMTNRDPIDESPSLTLPRTTGRGNEGSSPETPRTARSTAASTGRDLTWLDLRSSKVNFGESDTAGAPYLRKRHEAFIYTERGVYRPGETVHLRAIVRGPDGATPTGFPVRWQFRRPDLHDWKAVLGKIDADGCVSLDLPLPDDLPTGRWSVTLGLPGQNKPDESFGAASFQVEDFMPNRMQVAMKLDGHATTGSDESTPRFLVSDEPLAAEVQADYLFGKPAAERPAQLVARIDPTTFAPPQWRAWTFGDAASTAQTLEDLKVTGHRSELPEQQLDAKGHASFELDLASLVGGDETAPAKPVKRHKKGRSSPAATVTPTPGQPGGRYVGPWRLSVVASVTEAGGRSVSASTDAELDPLPWYIGIKARSAGASIDTPNSFDVTLVAPDGKIATQDVALEAMLYRESWNNSLAYENNRYVYHSTRLLDAVGEPLKVNVGGGKATFDLRPTAFGSYVLRVRDPKTGGMTSIAFYAGQGAWEDNISRENPEKLELLVQRLPDAAAIAAAMKHLGSGLKGEGALLVARASRPWELSSTGEAPVPQQSGSVVPELADGISALRSALQSPAGGKLRAGDAARVVVRSPFAGRLLLSVETDDVVTTRVIEMTASHVAVPIVLSGACLPNAYITATVVRAIDPDAAWQTHRAIGTVRVPLDNTDRKLNVHLAAPAEIRPARSLGVDLAVTDAAGNAVKDAAVTVAAVDEGICQLTGYGTPDPFAFFTRLRGLGVETADLYGQLMPEVPRAERISAVGGDKSDYDPRHGSPVSAKRVKPVALVSGVLHTDANGIAHADFAVPRFIGKLRLMAVASAGPATGSGESAVHVRSPLIVQSSWPRFAAPGDKFLVSLTLFNNQATGVETTVNLHVSDGPLRFGNSNDASIGAIRLPANGQTTQVVEVTAGRDAGVSHVSLIATAGGESYEEDVEIPVRPASPEIRVGGYAVARPAKPAEITLPGGMLKGTEHFQLRVTPWPSLSLPQGLDYLERYPYGCLEQTTSTLFPLVYLSDIGQQIAPGMFERDRVNEKVKAGITRLIGMQTASGGLAMWPAYREPWPWGTVYAAHFLIEAQNAGHPVPEEFRKSVLGYVHGLLNVSSDESEMLETQTYACYVLALAGQPDRSAMSRLAEIVRSPRPVGAAIGGQARLHLAAAWLAAGRRDLAEFLIPQSLPQPRGERSLSGSLGSPVRDRAILVDTLLAVQPDHPALPELVQQLADAGRNGQWRSTQDTAFAVLALGRYLRQSKSVAGYDNAELRLGESRVGEAASGEPLTWDGDGGSEGGKLRLSITGPTNAKAHVAWLQVGVPLSPPAAADHGMSIRRRLLDEHGKPLVANRVRSGDLVQVELTIASATPLEHVAIDDLLPAGLEIENPRLETTAADAADRPRDDAKPNVFQDARLDMRDDRLVLIGRLTASGSGTYVYTARAITPGTFALPPAHAECMYDTGTNSLGETGTFEVLPNGSPRIANVRD